MTISPATQGTILYLFGRGSGQGYGPASTAQDFKCVTNGPCPQDLVDLKVQTCAARSKQHPRLCLLHSMDVLRVLLYKHLDDLICNHVPKQLMTTILAHAQRIAQEENSCDTRSELDGVG